MNVTQRKLIFIFLEVYVPGINKKENFALGRMFFDRIHDVMTFVSLHASSGVGFSHGWVGGGGNI
jgi:hypothetical protein